MAKFKFIMSPMNSGLEFWSVNPTKMYENPESYVFRNMKFVGEVANIAQLIYVQQINTNLLNLVDNHC